MDARVIPRLSFANVVSVLALFAALGGTAWAASTLPPNSVGTKQLRSQAVTTEKIRPGAIVAPDLSFPLGAVGASGSTPVSLGAGQSADVLNATVKFPHPGSALSLATVELRAGKAGATVSLALVHSQNTYPLGSVTLAPNSLNTETGYSCYCRTAIGGSFEFSMRASVNSGSAIVLQRNLSEVALPAS